MARMESDQSMKEVSMGGLQEGGPHWWVVSLWLLRGEWIEGNVDKNGGEAVAGVMAGGRGEVDGE